MAVPSHVIDLTSSETEVQSEGLESEDEGVEPAGDVLDGESDSDDELQTVAGRYDCHSQH